MRHKCVPIPKLSNHKKDTKAAPYHNVWYAAGTCQVLLLQITIFKLNSEAFVHIVCVMNFRRWFLSITDNWISPLIKNWCPGWRPSYTCTQFALFSQGCCCCCNCFYPYCSSHHNVCCCCRCYCYRYNCRYSSCCCCTVAGAFAALLAAAEVINDRRSYPNWRNLVKNTPKTFIGNSFHHCFCCMFVVWIVMYHANLYIRINNNSNYTHAAETAVKWISNCFWCFFLHERKHLQQKQWWNKFPINCF